MATTHIGDLLQDSVERSGFGDEVLAARVIEEAKRIVGELFGTNQGFVIPKSFQKGELRIGARAPAAGVELRNHEHELLSQLRKKFPGVRIEYMRIIPQP